MRTWVRGFRELFIPSVMAVLAGVLSPVLMRGQDSAPAPSAAPQQEIKYSQDPNASKNMTLLLKDFEPKSMMHAEAHEVPRAKFPVIDMHNHVNDAGGIHGDPISPEEVVRRMNRMNVEKIVILTGMWGEKLQGVLDKMVKPFPDRFIVFAQYDWSKINDANFSAEMVAQLDDAVRRGARGLKVLKDLGLGVRDRSGKLIAIDDPRLDPVWEECGRLGIPVAIHSTDPEAFFTPLDNHNERYEELITNPSWSFYGSQFPSKETLLAQRNHVFEKHPHTTFVALHVANWPENLNAVSAWLDKYPNMYVEFGARQAELGRQPRRSRKFFVDYQDRILFGTDSEPEEAMYANYFRWLETGDEYFPYWGYPGQGRWEIYGMELPDGVLEKVYHKNADKIFAQFKGWH
ncbi:MAG TPA: amidohydrolase family protein [Candidatus Limnocylindrales bacterium]|nr:amidohydrolase family protein [Candidatus Limnocylindrales bacterium]